jgi:hypothetical protein
MHGTNQRQKGPAVERDVQRRPNVSAVLPAADLSIALPDDWVELDLDPVTRVAGIRCLAEQRAARFPELRQRLPQLTSLLLAHAAASADAGAVYCATFSEVEDRVPLAAGLTIFLFDALTRDDGTAVTDPHELATVLADEVPESQRRDGGREVSVVELIPGPAVRVRALEEAADDRRREVSDTVQYFVPVPGTEQTVVLSFSTPVVAAGDAFAELFDVIASSFHF